MRDAHDARLLLDDLGRLPQGERRGHLHEGGGLTQLLCLLGDRVLEVTLRLFDGLLHALGVPEIVLGQPDAVPNRLSERVLVAAALSF